MNLLCWSMAPSTRVTRKWEVFAGRNKFYCDGYLMSAPNTGVFYFTVFLVTFTSALFFGFDCPYLAIRITPAIPVIGGLLYIFTMGSLLRTTFTDPGVIPRASQDEAAYIEKQIEVPNSLNSPTFRPPPRTKEVLVKGQTVKLKYCFTCKIFRPPRASHCSLCDNCVDRFDHHCPWVGNCVGKRNYRFFYMFIVSLAFLAVFIFSCSLTHLILLAKDGEDDEFVEVIRQSPFSVVVTIICFFSIWSVIGLAGFHTYLTTSDQTTNEDIKGSFSTKGAQNAVNPYSHGNICMNCFYIICGPMTPSLIDRRGIVTDEYRIQMQQPDRYNMSIHQPLQVTVSSQPRGSNEQINKLNYYDIESGPTLMNSGIYRQRSYDNLQNGNSTSVAHLVDNELPISTLHSPLGDASAAVGLAKMPSTPNNDDDDDDDNIENLSNRNNLSGSYSNLFREKLDDDDDDDEADDDNVDDGNDIGLHAGKDIHTLTHLGTDAVVMSTASTLIGVADGMLRGENVYSNIPHTSGVQMSVSMVDSGIGDKCDPNLHVYSNVEPPPLPPPMMMSSASSIKQSDTSFGGVSAIGVLPMVDDSFVGPVRSSSTMLADDLDLDDPVSVAGTFGQTPKKAQTGRSKANDAGNAHAQTNNIMPAGAKMTKSISIEMKNVIPPVVVMDGAGAVQSTNSVAAGTSSSSSTTNAFCSPSRMRLLHDTTMIDTALDLDSLDGSSLGNSSQACLVKTAIV